MNQFLPYVIIFVTAILILRVVTQHVSRHNRAWQSCAQKYRLSFKEGKEQKGERTIRAYRLKGYYRTCLLSILSSPTMGSAETSVSVSYPKGLSDSLTNYPTGVLGRIGKGLARYAEGAAKGSQRPYVVTIPTQKGAEIVEMQKELNPTVREQLTQLMIICSGKGKRIDITDAYLLYRQQGFVARPEELFPIIDEMLLAINTLESCSGDLLK